MAQGTMVDGDEIAGASPPPSEPARRRFGRGGGSGSLWQNVTVVAAVLAVAYLSLVPLIYLLWGTFWDDGVTFDNMRAAYGRSGIGELFRNSVTFAVGSTIVSVVLGAAFAYLVVRTDVRFKGILFAASVVPIVIPGILQTIAWVFLLSPRTGLFNTLLEPLFGPGFFNVFSMGGMIWVEGTSNAPLCFLLMYASFRSMDPSLEESALMSGAPLRVVLSRITLPLVKPAMYAAVLIMFVKSIEAFETPALLGLPQGIQVFTSRIWRVLNQFPPGYGEAGAYAVVLLVITTIGVFLQNRFSNRGRAFQTVTGKGFRPHPMELGRARGPVTALALGYFVIGVVMPILILLWASLQPYYTSPDADALSRLTLANYQFALTNVESITAWRNSLILGVGTATAVMFCMSIIAWITVRTKIRGRWVLDNLTFLPLTIPGLVLGVALLFVYLRVPLPVYGTLWLLFIAYFTKYMPYGMRYAATSMYQIAAELEESAQTSGATWWQMFRRVILPLLMPGLVAGWIYVLMVSFRELSSSILLYSPGTEVMAVLIWRQWENGQFVELSALGMLMIVAMLVMVVIARKLGAQVGVRE